MLLVLLRTVSLLTTIHPNPYVSTEVDFFFAHSDLCDSKRTLTYLPYICETFGIRDWNSLLQINSRGPNIPHAP